MPESIFQIRYTVPGLGYFTVAYLCLAFFFPERLSFLYESTWFALAGIAAIGTIPAGYLINQLVLLWEFLRGRYEGFDHIQDLGDLISDPNMTSRTITLHLGHRVVCVEIAELRDELMHLGREYLRRTCVWSQETREAIERRGLMAPLHDVIFLDSKVHERYLRTGWLHSNATAVLLVALILAIVPWTVAGCTHDFALALVQIYLEFALLAVAGGWVFYCTRVDADLKERFLTWLYARYVR